MAYRDVIDSVKREGRRILTEYESKEVLKEFGIPVLNEYFIKEVSELDLIAPNIRFPVVAKGVSRTIAHKTEKNLVRLYIKNPSELKSEFLDIMKNEEVEGVLISPQILDKREFLLGLRYDDQFGYVVVFGLGGIFTEALRDITMRVCPITKDEAMDMIREVRYSKLLGSIRGFKAVNIERIADTIVNLSRLSEVITEISEIDINPLMFDETDPVVVDALIVLKG